MDDVVVGALSGLFTTSNNDTFSGEVVVGTPVVIAEVVRSWEEVASKGMEEEEESNTSLSAAVSPAFIVVVVVVVEMGIVSEVVESPERMQGSSFRMEGWES